MASNIRSHLPIALILSVEESCEWRNIIYVGDNPNKDFVSLNKMGAITIRVLTGYYSSFKASASYDASSINSLATLSDLLSSLN